MTDRWSPFGLRWYVVVNDLIGGWAVSHVDKPLSEQDFRNGEGDIFDSLTKELAEYIVALHHAHVGGLCTDETPCGNCSRPDLEGTK